MGLNAYLEAAQSYGQTVNPATAGTTVVYMSGRPGKRISILAYAHTTPSVATSVYFQVPISGVNTLVSALTAASTSFTWSARPSNIATADYVSIQLDDQTYIFGSLNSTATTSLVLVSAGTMGAAAIGNPIYYFASATTNGHYKVTRATGLTQYTDADQGGVGRFFGSVMGGPMIAWQPAVAAGTAIAGSWDYITTGFINV